MLCYEVDTFGRLARIDGRYPHWVAPYEGERYSVIYYQTSGERVQQAAAVDADSLEPDRDAAGAGGGEAGAGGVSEASELASAALPLHVPLTDLAADTPRPQ
jgi:hypothetical protein